MELTEENYPHMNIPRMSSEGMTTDEIKRLVTLVQRFNAVSDDHLCAILEAITAARDEEWKEFRNHFEKMKTEDPEAYAAFQERCNEAP